MRPLYNFAYRGEQDLPAIMELVLHTQLSGRADKWPTMAELRLLCHPLRTDWHRQLWLDSSERLQAFALLECKYGGLSFWLQDQIDPAALLPKIIAWALAQRRVDQPDNVAIRCQIRADLPDSVALIERAGFTRHALSTLRLTRSLAEPLPNASLPAGFVIRLVAGEEEAAAYVSLHNAAFGRQQTTPEEIAARLAFMHDPGYQPALDLVVVAPDGTLAAFCVGQLDVEGNAHRRLQEAWTDPIGTHPTFQRRGLARALLVALLHRLRADGVDLAVLGTGSWNSATQQLCASVGFQVAYEIAWYTLTAT